MCMGAVKLQQQQPRPLLGGAAPVVMRSRDRRRQTIVEGEGARYGGAATHAHSQLHSARRMRRHRRLQHTRLDHRSRHLRGLMPVTAHLLRPSPATCPAWAGVAVLTSAHTTVCTQSHMAGWLAD